MVNGIQREEIVDRPELGLHLAQWTIHFHSFAGRDNQIHFKSDGFVMKLTKQPQTTECQRLEDNER